MPVLSRLLAHDAWTTRQLLLLAQPLTDAQLDQSFDLGLGTLRATFRHVIRNMEAWTDLMNGAPIRPDGDATIDGLLHRLDVVAPQLAACATGLAQAGRLDDRWIDPAETPPVERTFGGTIAHVITHSMHHRAQLLFMLRRLGVPNVPEGDVLSWEAHQQDSAKTPPPGA
ncbi:MAG: DinB family protein [Phycisphaerales bacterium]|nr:DinB family protein [Phycisphaerales bacterium]